MKFIDDRFEFKSTKLYQRLVEAHIPGLRLSQGTPHYALGDVSAVTAAAILLGWPANKVPTGSVGYSYERSPFELRSYQKLGVGWLIRTLKQYGGAILADDTGLGKTLQAITTVNELSSGRILIIAPAAARETWRDELVKWQVPIEDTVVLAPGSSEWKRASKARVVVCSYDHRVLTRCIELAFDEVLPQFIVLDEVHRVRGRKSARSKALLDIMPLAQYRLALSATPQFDRPRDLYQILRMLFGYSFGNQWDFDRRYCAGKPGVHGGLENKGVSNEDELKLRLSYYMLRREKRDVAAELPPLIRSVRWVDATPEAKRAWHAAHMGFSAHTLHAALVATLKGKMPEALDLAEEAKRFLLLTWMKEHAHQMARTLNLERGTPCLAVDGTMSDRQRKEAVMRATTNGWGIVGTLDSFSESLNLQGLANVQIMHYIPYEPRKAVQAEGRLHRLGQQSNVLVHYVAMRDSADLAVMKTFINKLDQGRVTVGEKENRKLRHAIGDAIDGPQSVLNEKEVLARIYKEMKG